MSPHSTDAKGVKTHLEEALSTAENSETKYHIREALQLTELYR